MPRSGHTTDWLLKFNRSDETRIEILESFDAALDRANALSGQENTALLELSGPDGTRLDGEAIRKALRRPLKAAFRIFHAPARGVSHRH